MVLCWFAFQCAALFRATVLAHEKRPITASLRPLGVYIYAFGSQSCATRLVFEGSARQDPDRDRAWHPRELGQGDACSSLALGKSSTPPARCIHHSRHDASSAEYRLLASFAPGVASREPESRRSPALAPRTRRLAPTFRCGAFFFVAPALADVPSARLTLSAAKVPQRYPMLYDSSRRWLTLALFRPHHNLISNISSHSV